MNLRPSEIMKTIYIDHAVVDNYTDRNLLCYRYIASVDPYKT